MPGTLDVQKWILVYERKIFTMKTRIYELADGGRIVASSAEEFVRLLRESSRFDSDCTDEQYIKRFASRYKDLYGVQLKTDTSVHFVEDLHEHGYIVS